MERKSFEDMPCPIARTLDRVGEWWSILIVRDALKGLTRFDQFQRSLGIAPNMLTRRLKTLVESGLLERRLYNDKPPRHEYLLTQKGRDFQPVLWALVAWGNQHLAPDGETFMVVDAKTGERAEPVLVDARSGRRLSPPDFRMATGPAASEALQRRYAQFSASSGASESPNSNVETRADAQPSRAKAKSKGVSK